jgi:hypothetical protein
VEFRAEFLNVFNHGLNSWLLPIDNFIQKERYLAPAGLGKYRISAPSPDSGSNLNPEADFLLPFRDRSPLGDRIFAAESSLNK